METSTPKTIVPSADIDLPLATAAKRALVDRVAASELFGKAPRLREFLLYTAECTLENRLSEVREQVIAERVFARRPDFQSTQDSIVRAEARNLRKRLETYFALEGRDEPTVITMPKGGYALAFESRLLAVPLELYSPAPSIEPHPAGSRATFPLILGKAQRFLVALCAVLIVVLLAFAAGSHAGRVGLEQRLGIAQPILPFSALFEGGQQSFVVTSDVGFLQIGNLAHRSLSLNDYIARTYPEPVDVKPPDLIRNWNLYEFTDGREMNIAGLILSSYPQFAHTVALRSGHQVTLDELKSHTAVMIGSPISNPWAQLYEDRLNFHCALDSAGNILFRDNGKQYPNADDSGRGRTYARLAFLPGSADTPAALLIAGTTAQSTEAAGDLVVDRTRFTRTLRAIGIDPTGPPRFFEILLRSNAFVGGSTAPEIVGWRVAPVPEK